MIDFLKLTLALIGKFGATAVFTIVFVYTAELFPTEIRSTAVGSSSTCARVGGIVAPQVKNLQNKGISTQMPFFVRSNFWIPSGARFRFWSSGDAPSSGASAPSSTCPRPWGRSSRRRWKRRSTWGRKNPLYSRNQFKLN